MDNSPIVVNNPFPQLLNTPQTKPVLLFILFGGAIVKGYTDISVKNINIHVPFVFLLYLFPNHL
jgi:hypothetical protein